MSPVTTVLLLALLAGCSTEATPPAESATPTTVKPKPTPDRKGQAARAYFHDSTWDETT
jgi:hypothetical protein